MTLLDKYLDYIGNIRRYSGRTMQLYGEVLGRFEEYSGDFPDSLTVPSIRNYEVHLLDAEGLDARTVNMQLSVISSFCRYLVRQGVLSSNPAKTVPRPKLPKKLPVFYREESMEDYFRQSAFAAGPEAFEIFRSSDGKTRSGYYKKRLDRLIISLLFSTGMRRAELISLERRSLDLHRRVIRVKGKGDKMREIPLVPSLCEEISLYLQAADLMFDSADDSSPLLRTVNGGPLYPVYVDRTVKSELGGVRDLSGRKSPHVLRHTLATELLDGGADLNSIKELLGHASLAATQVYTHNTVERLKNIYNQAHPRAAKEGENGD